MALPFCYTWGRNAKVTLSVLTLKDNHTKENMPLNKLETYLNTN